MHQSASQPDYMGPASQPASQAALWRSVVHPAAGGVRRTAGAAQAAAQAAGVTRRRLRSRPMETIKLLMEGTLVWKSKRSTCRRRIESNVSRICGVAYLGSRQSSSLQRRRAINEVGLAEVRAKHANAEHRQAREDRPAPTPPPPPPPPAPSLARTVVAWMELKTNATNNN